MSRHVVRARPRRQPDDGSATIEFIALGVPIALVMSLFAVFAYRISAAGIDVHAAAAAAARAASLARTPQAARTAATQAATTDLANHHITCAPIGIGVDVSDFRRGGTVSVALDCTIATADLLGLGLPGAVHRTAAATAVIDTYRAVSTAGEP